VQGCDPEPNFGTPEGPFVGIIQTETNVTATGASQTIGFFPNELLEQGFDLRISIQPGAYAPGTRVTVRLVVGLDLDADADIAFNQIVGLGFEALQILPANVPPVTPLRIDVAGSLQPWPFEVLHAREGDTKWTAVGTLPPPDASAPFPGMSFDVDQPGLWTLGQRPLPPSIQGHLDRSLGPAVGHLYAGEYARSFLWTAFRTGATVLGTALILASMIHDSDCQGSQCEDSKGGIGFGSALLLGSVASALYDIYDAPRAAGRANARNAAANVALVPMVDAHGPTVSRGAALVGRF
jgi:hypothetical protein